MQFPQKHHTMLGEVVVYSWQKITYNGRPAIRAKVKNVNGYFGLNRSVDIYEQVDNNDGTVTVVYLNNNTQYRSAVVALYSMGEWEK